MYLQANDAYLQMAIGNAPWPIGVTMVGIHARTGREKIFSKHVAHVLNDETQRKYIQVWNDSSVLLRSAVLFIRSVIVFFSFFSGAEKINDNLSETFPNRSLKVCGVQRSVMYTSQHSKLCCLSLAHVVYNLLIVNIPQFWEHLDLYSSSFQFWSWEPTALNILYVFLI